MKELLLLRHAKSSWEDERLSDLERPLNRRGKEDAPRMGRLLRQRELVPDLIISSPAVRAITTAKAVALAAGYGYENEIRLVESLYHAGPDSYLELLRDVPDRYGRVMAVGHNPGMEELVELLAGQWERIPTGTIAYFQLELDHWVEINDLDAVAANLVEVWRPKEMKV
jgi:phosphohistidine phosphatase